MKILNLGCGSTRPKEDVWVNLDDLHSQLTEDGPEKRALDAEPNYCQHVIEPDGELPFSANRFDGILASHFFEHFDCQEAVKILRQCRAVMKPGGVIVVSVPNAPYFRAVYGEDRNENWPKLFGVNDPPNPIPTFFEAALFLKELTRERIEKKAVSEKATVAVGEAVVAGCRDKEGLEVSCESK